MECLCLARGWCFLVFILQCFLILQTSARGNLPKAECNSPTLGSGSKSTVKCYFDVNYKNRSRTIYLEHLNTDTSDYEVVALCQRSSGKFVCKTMQGYNITKDVTDSLVVEIQDTRPIHEGKYWCSGFEIDRFKRNMCDLSIKDSQSNKFKPPSLITAIRIFETEGMISHCDAESVSFGEPAIISCNFSKDLSNTTEDVEISFQKEGEFPVPVIYYSWVNGESVVENADGYKDISRLTDKCDIMILQATQNHTGMYKCIVVNYKGNNFKHCNVSVADNIEDVEKEGNKTKVIIAVIVPCLLLIIAICIIIYALRKQGSTTKWRAIFNSNGNDYDNITLTQEQVACKIRLNT